MPFQAPPGTEDVLPERVPLWLRVEEAVRRVFGAYGYEEVRAPVFEYTQLFHKSTGEVTDIVEKEMYTFGDAEESFSLRPELTPSIARILVEHSLFAKRNFWKLFYIGAAFRKERPQKGRLRQFHQLGVEAVGSADPALDAETILMFQHLLRDLGVTRYEARINSIGCPECRPAYRELLRKAIEPEIARYCENCRRRLGRNVFRILDCKACVALTEKLPPVIEHTCAKCKEHLAAVEKALAGAPYKVDPRIVRGLDYYTRTVYEFRSDLLGAQDAIGGGGRYDTLIRDMGGPDVGAVGFAAGVERILLCLDAAGAKIDASRPDFYVVAVDGSCRPEAFRVANSLRGAGLAGDLDFEGRSLKAQFRTANKSGARTVLVVGPDEMARGKVKLKNMQDGTEREASLDEARAILKGGTT
ncbi:MAG: histidine--tRNA ligase [Planctomycetes bacterium]|nr:histidine--tRNA ligase [Planctomycetota bacterium]